jgi:hypothetical protein
LLVALNRNAWLPGNFANALFVLNQALSFRYELSFNLDQKRQLFLFTPPPLQRLLARGRVVNAAWDNPSTVEFSIGGARVYAVLEIEA